MEHGVNAKSFTLCSLLYAFLNYKILAFQIYNLQSTINELVILDHSFESLLEGRDRFQLVDLFG
jgi:hypothetical protein